MITKQNLKDIELYYHPKQKNGWIQGNDLYQHLKDEDILKDCLTLQDLEDIQKLGIKEFNKYFKNKYVFGWNSVQNQFGYLLVPYLCENGDRVVVVWGWLDDSFFSSDPALRFSKSFELNPFVSIESLPLELEKAIKICKENGLKVMKEM